MSGAEGAFRGHPVTWVPKRLQDVLAKKGKVELGGGPFKNLLSSQDCKNSACACVFELLMNIVYFYPLCKSNGWGRIC